ncbi:MAG TPA: hypothetical protein VEB63_03970 [Chitinophagaceae bacterium]|nr:hypothetical protein [Chitinophagaceae bacterium]
MKKKLRDRHLGPPSEANRDKHINFVAIGNQDADPAADYEDSRGAPRRNRKQRTSYKGSNRGNPR